MALLPALVFGALITATDPISVLALFSSLGLQTAVHDRGRREPFSDGAAVLFQILLAAWHRRIDPLAGVWRFLVVAIGGLAIGLTLGYVVSVTEQIDDPQVEITLTTILAYGSFLLAEHFTFRA